MKGEKQSRHGLYGGLARVKLRGLEDIDRRTTAARALLDWREQVYRDLGGLENIPATRVKLVELAATTAALISHADEFLLE